MKNVDVNEVAMSDNTQPLITEEMLERIAWYAIHASKPPVCVIQVPDGYDPIEWYADALQRTVGNKTYGVALGNPDDIAERGEAILTAMTGNGSASRDNANFYMLCHTA